MENEKRYLLIKYREGERVYNIFSDDFEKVRHYCLNECMGIQFLNSAEFLLKLVNILKETGAKPPFDYSDFVSEKIKKILKEKGYYKEMEKKFGTPDLDLVVTIIIKQTYNFLHKI